MKPINTPIDSLYNREHVENGRNTIEGVNIQTSAWSFGDPNLAAWRAQKDWDEEVNNIEDTVDHNKGLGKPVARKTTNHSTIGSAPLGIEPNLNQKPTRQ